MAFSPDGMRVVTGSYDGTARVWPLVQDLPELAQLAWQRIASLRRLSEAQKQRFFIEECRRARPAHRELCRDCGPRFPTIACLPSPVGTRFGWPSRSDPRSFIKTSVNIGCIGCGDWFVRRSRINVVARSDPILLFTINVI